MVISLVKSMGDERNIGILFIRCQEELSGGKVVGHRDKDDSFRRQEIGIAL
jgi:hypothetical protein